MKRKKAKADTEDTLRGEKRGKGDILNKSSNLLAAADRAAAAGRGVRQRG
jgi:hypothetical protein